MIKLEIENTEQTIVIDGAEYLLVPKPKIEKLLADNFDLKDKLAEKEADIKILRHAINCILKIFGLLDEKTGAIRQSIVTGEESYIKHILKALKNVVVLMGTSQFSKKAEAELLELFSFIGPLVPLINKYSQNERTEQQ